MAPWRQRPGAAAEIPTPHYDTNSTRYGSTAAAAAGTTADGVTTWATSITHLQAGYARGWLLSSA